jgi:hypothetical protein
MPWNSADGVHLRVVFPTYSRVHVHMFYLRFIVASLYQIQHRIQNEGINIMSAYSCYGILLPRDELLIKYEGVLALGFLANLSFEKHHSKA